MITFTTPLGICKGYIIRQYPSGHRFLVRCLDGTTRLVDLAQLLGTRELRMKS